MIRAISGRVKELTESSVVLEIGAFEYEVLVPELVRRALQGCEGQVVRLHTLHYLEGGPNQNRLMPRLVGFRTTTQREFFELLSSVNGLGIRKALRAFAWPVAEMASAIHRRDTALLSDLPGIGKATAERMCAQLHKDVERFLAVYEETPSVAGLSSDDINAAFQTLLQVGWSEAEARADLDAALAGGAQYSSVEDLLKAVFSGAASKK